MAARKRRSGEGQPQQLPLLCQRCVGPVSARRTDTHILIRCEECNIDLLAIPLAVGESIEEEIILKAEERRLIKQVPAPARALYEYLRRYVRRHGYAPSHREMRDALGWTSSNQVRHYLDRLEEVNLIERDYGAARGIRLPHAA